MATPSEIFDDFQEKLAFSIRQRLAAQMAPADLAAPLPPGELFDPESDPRVSAVFDAASGMFLPKGAAPPFPNWRNLLKPYDSLQVSLSQCCIDVAGTVRKFSNMSTSLVYDNYGNVLMSGVYIIRGRAAYRTRAIDSVPNAVYTFLQGKFNHMEVEPCDIKSVAPPLTVCAGCKTSNGCSYRSSHTVVSEAAANALLLRVVKLDKIGSADIRAIEKVWQYVADKVAAVLGPVEHSIDVAERTVFESAALVVPSADTPADVDLAAQVRVEARVTVVQLTRQNSELAAHASRLAAELARCHDRETALRGETAAAEKRGDDRLAELRSRFDALRCDLDESRRRYDNLTQLEVARAAVLDKAAVVAEQLEQANKQVATLTQRNRELLDAVTRATREGRDAAAVGAKTHEALAADLKKADAAADAERVRAGRAERERDEARATVASLNAQLVARLGDSPPAYGDAVAASYAEQLADAEKRAAAAEKRCEAMAKTVAARDAALKRAVDAAATLTAALK